MNPLANMHSKITPLVSGGNRPLQMTFGDQLNALVFYHLEEYDSGLHLLQAIK